MADCLAYLAQVTDQAVASVLVMFGLPIGRRYLYEQVESASVSDADEGTEAMKTRLVQDETCCKRCVCRCASCLSSRKYFLAFLVLQLSVCAFGVILVKRQSELQKQQSKLQKQLNTQLESLANGHLELQKQLDMQLESLAKGHLELQKQLGMHGESLEIVKKNNLKCHYDTDVTVLWWPSGQYRFNGYSFVDLCELRNCIVASSEEKCAARADVLLYHLPETDIRSALTKAQAKANRVDTRRGHFVYKRKRHKLQVAIGVSMESTKNYPYQAPAELRSVGFDLLATTNPDSDFRVTYFDLDGFEHLQTMNFAGWIARKPAAAFVASNCHDKVRTAIASKLAQRGVQVDSLGKCVPKHTRGAHNATYRDGSKILQLMDYRVYLAFENSRERGYVTEKILDGYKAGTVPVYFGAPDVDLYVPPESAVILPDDTNESMDVLAADILEVLHNQSRWEQMMKWRSTNISTWLSRSGVLLTTYWQNVSKLKFSLCNVCKKVQELRQR